MDHFAHFTLNMTFVLKFTLHVTHHYGSLCNLLAAAKLNAMEFPEDLEELEASLVISLQDLEQAQVQVSVVKNCFFL